MTPHTPRHWRRASKIGLLLVVAVLSASGVPAAAQNNLSTNQPRSAAGAGISKRGYISMIARRNPVLGEKFEISIQLPADAPENLNPSLQWAIASGPGNGWVDSSLRNLASSTVPNVAPLPAGKRFLRDSILAPFIRPGSYELRLLNSGQLIDVLPVRVETGRVRGAIVPTKRVFRQGERIEFTLTVPGNRYYYGQWNGPVVTLVPDSVGGRRIPTTEAMDWWGRAGRDCGNPSTLCTMMIKEFASKPGSNPFDEGVSIQPGTYTVNERFVTERKLESALFAPKEPGVYKLRFYDRGYAWLPATFFDLFIDEAEIVVEEAGSSPSVLQFVTKCGPDVRDAAALKKLTLGEPSFLAAVFDVIPGVEEPAERTAILERVDLGKIVKSRTKLTRVAPGVYCSGPIVPFAPAEPRRTAGRPS